MNTGIPRPSCVDWLEDCLSYDSHFEANGSEPAELLAYIQHLEKVRNILGNLVGVGFLRLDAPARHHALAMAAWTDLQGMLHPPPDDAVAEDGEGEP